MGNPTLLLMDEPLEGLAPIIVETLLAAMKRLINEEALTVVLVEQHARLALGVTQNALVLNRGRIAYSGASSVLLEDPQRLTSLVVPDAARRIGRSRLLGIVFVNTSADKTSAAPSATACWPRSPRWRAQRAPRRPAPLRRRGHGGDRRVPRHRFVPPDQARAAYENRALPIGNGQTISQPYIVAS